MRPLSNRALAVCLLVFLSSCAGSYRRWPDGPPVQLLKSGASSSDENLRFRFQPFTDPQLDALKAREKLADVVDTSSGQFNQIRQIRNWAASQWPPGVPDPYPPWNALTVLDWIRGGRTGGHCGQYSQLLLQALAAMGFTARYVEVGSRDNPYAHYVTEVWSNDHDKWVMMDAAYNVHFELRGIPLSVLEIHHALVTGRARALDARSGRQPRGYNAVKGWPLRTAELYYYIRFHLKADHLSKPDEPAFDRFKDMVEWSDAHTVPWEESQVPSVEPKQRLTERQTGSEAQAAPHLNQVFVDAALGERDVTLRLRHNVLDFREFQYRIVGKGLSGQWQSTRDTTVRVPLAKPQQTIEVRGLNVRGVSGPLAIVAVRMPSHPPKS